MLNDLSSSFLEFLQRRMRGKVTSIYQRKLHKLEGCCDKE